MSARRRERAARRAQAVLDMQVRWAFLQGTTPPSAVAVTSCSCGWLSWLMPGAGPDDFEAFTQSAADHDYVHELEEWDASDDTWSAA